jgi:hypothetical protein
MFSIFSLQIRSRGNKEKTIDGLHRQVIDGFEKDKFDLSRQLSVLKADVSALKTENADLNAIKIVHQNKIKVSTMICLTL